VSDSVPDPKHFLRNYGSAILNYESGSADPSPGGQLITDQDPTWNFFVAIEKYAVK
jgi:hypothetical protein